MGKKKCEKPCDYSSSSSSSSVATACGKKKNKADCAQVAPSMVCGYFPVVLSIDPPTEQFPSPAVCEGSAPCGVPIGCGAVFVSAPGVGIPPPALPIFLPPNAGPEYRFSPAEAYVLKAGAADTHGYAEIFEIVVASGFQSFYSASLQSDTFFYAASGDFNYQVSNLSDVFLQGSSLFVKKGTPFGITMNTPGSGRILGVYTPPGTLGYFVESSLSRCAGVLPVYDPCLSAKYSLVSGYALNYWDNVYCQETCQTACVPFLPACPKPCKAKVPKCPPLPCQPGIILPTPPPTSVQPTPQFPFAQTEPRRRNLPFRNPIILAPGAGPVYSATGTSTWTLLAGSVDTCGYAEYLTAVINPAVPIAGTFANADIFVYGLIGAPTVTVNGTTYAVAPGAFVYIPRGASFSIASVAAGSTILIGFIGSAAFGLFYGQIQIILSGAVPPQSTALLAQLNQRYCYIPPPAA